MHKKSQICLFIFLFRAQTFHSFNSKYIGSIEAASQKHHHHSYFSQIVYLENVHFSSSKSPNWPSLSLRVIMHASFHLKSESHTQARD